MKIKNIESAKIVVFRIYATNAYYRDPENSNEIIHLEPLIIDAFPEDGCKLKCYFGKVPEDIISAKEKIDRFDLLRFKAFFTNSVDISKTPKELLEDCIAEIRLHTNRFTKFKWYTTIVIEKDVDIHEFETLCPDEKIQYEEFLNFFIKNLEGLQYPEIFDKVAFCLMMEFDKDLFSEQLVETYFFVINETDVFRNPIIFSGVGDLSVGKKYESIDHDPLISVMRGALQNKLLSKIVHWRMAMLNERDKWKKYYFGFLCLENLTHTAFEIIFMQNQFDLYSERSNEYDKSIITPLLDEDPEEDELKLTNEFYYVVGVLNPDKYSDDVTKFKKCYDRRNKISHGKVLNVNELPFNELNSLLDFYTIEMLKF